MGADEEIRQAPTWKVVLAWLLDLMTVVVFGGYAIADATGQSTQHGFRLSGWPALLLFGLIVAYFVIGKWVFGRTLWKRILGVPR
jgi:hypothetical protein